MKVQMDKFTGKNSTYPISADYGTPRVTSDALACVPQWEGTILDHQQPLVWPAWAWLAVWLLEEGVPESGVGRRGWHLPEGWSGVTG